MPAGRPSQDSSLFYAVVVFVGLFIVSTALAVVFYLKFADFQKQVQDADRRVEELATAQQVKNLGQLMGSKEERTALGTMFIRFDALANLILGSVPSDATAQAKVEMAQNQAKAILAQLQTTESNSVGLIRAIETLKTQYDQAVAQYGETSKKLAELSQLSDEEKKAAIEKEKETSAYITKLKDDSDRATKGYEDLKAMMKQNADQQVSALAARLDTADQELKKEQQERLSLTAKLRNADERISLMQTQLELIVPKPDSSAAAFKSDGKIISLDNSTKTVIINIGSDDHVYRGLTFAVYDKALPIPRDGKGKATIEVFDIQKKVSAARITSASKQNPIMDQDKIANLIWDAKAKKEFVVAGIFPSGEGVNSVKELVSKWGGKVAEKVSITTNFVVLGTAPAVPQKPTAEMIDADPTANAKYETDLKTMSEYNSVLEDAKTLSVPIFSLERFMDFIGSTSANK
jgi:hypothetical protein